MITNNRVSWMTIGLGIGLAALAGCAAPTEEEEQPVAAQATEETAQTPKDDPQTEPTGQTSSALPIGFGAAVVAPVGVVAPIGGVGFGGLGVGFGSVGFGTTAAFGTTMTTMGTGFGFAPGFVGFAPGFAGIGFAPGFVGVGCAFGCF